MKKYIYKYGPIKETKNINVLAPNWLHKPRASVNVDLDLAICPGAQAIPYHKMFICYLPGQCSLYFSVYWIQFYLDDMNLQPGYGQMGKWIPDELRGKHLEKTHQHC